MWLGAPFDADDVTNRIFILGVVQISEEHQIRVRRRGENVIEVFAQ